MRRRRRGDERFECSASARSIRSRPCAPDQTRRKHGSNVPANAPVLHMGTPSIFALSFVAIFSPKRIFFVSTQKYLGLTQCNDMTN